MTDKMIDRLPIPEIAGAVIPWFSPRNRPTQNRLTETSGLVEALGCKLAFLDAYQVRDVNSAVLFSGGLLTRFADALEEAADNRFDLDLKAANAKALAVEKFDRKILALQFVDQLEAVYKEKVAK